MSDEEVLNELAGTQKVTEIELRQLAQNRAVRIREFLVGEDHAGGGQEANQGNQASQAKQNTPEDQPDQSKEDDQGSAGKHDQEQETRETKLEQEQGDNHMSEDRVFLMEVELGASGNEQVRCKLNLSGI